MGSDGKIIGIGALPKIINYFWPRFFTIYVAPMSRLFSDHLFFSEPASNVAKVETDRCQVEPHPIHHVLPEWDESHGAVTTALNGRTLLG